MNKVDLCIIGAGAGGLSLAAGAAQMGASVTLIEGARMGGDCLNVGCVPSKALLAAAGIAASRSTGAALGIAPARAEVDFTAVKAHVAGVIAGIAPHDSQERFEGLGVHVIRDWARFTGPDQVSAGGQTIRARRFVIATGSRPSLPAVSGLEHLPYLTNETIFDLTACPEHLIILGGGPIGLEMAQAHRRLGARVTLIESGACLGRSDREAAQLVLAQVQAEGVRIIEGRQLARLERGGAGLVARLADGDEVIEGTHLLVAAGRVAALDRLDLAAAGIAHEAGGVTVGPDLRSVSNRRVYAIGDAAAGAPRFTHVAGAHAGIVLRQVLFGLGAKAPLVVPSVTYTAPELAQIGPTEAEARQRHGRGLTVIRQDFAQNDRARAEGQTTGFVKLMVLRGKPIGVTIVGPGAGDLIAPWVLAIGQGLRLSAMAGMILPYPTRGEIAKRAAGAYFSPRLFASPWIKRLVRTVQRLVP